jgi:Protein of unknown function (DUF3768)
MDIPAIEKTRRIRQLNDAFRKSSCGGQVTVTAGVHALPADRKAKVLEMVRTFDTFDGDNDPHNEHDFCSFKIDDESTSPKSIIMISTFATDRRNPSDPTKTTRVLTIMRADE